MYDHVEFVYDKNGVVRHVFLDGVEMMCAYANVEMEPDCLPSLTMRVYVRNIGWRIDEEETNRT